jgi:hypothetical protein
MKTYYVQTAEGQVYATHNPEYWKECRILTKSAGSALYREQTRASMLESIKPGDTICCIIRSVSSSGMSRRISLFHTADGKLRDITHNAAVIMGDSCTDGAIRVQGCGMDMCFHTVYTLGRYLWPNGTPEPHGRRNGVPDSDGGYALRHSTI